MISDTRKQSNQKEFPSFLSWWRRRAVLERRFQVLYALVLQKKGLGTRRLMVWFTYRSAILLITLTTMLLVLPVVLPPLPPPPPVLMFLPIVILVCLLVIALVPTGFNGVVVGYMWSILVSFPPPPSFVNYYVQKAVQKLWRKNCQDEFASCFWSTVFVWEVYATWNDPDPKTWELGIRNAHHLEHLRMPAECQQHRQMKSGVLWRCLDFEWSSRKEHGIVSSWIVSDLLLYVSLWLGLLKTWDKLLVSALLQSTQLDPAFKDRKLPCSKLENSSIIDAKRICFWTLRPVDIDLLSLTHKKRNFAQVESGCSILFRSMAKWQHLQCLPAVTLEMVLWECQGFSKRAGFQQLPLFLSREVSK